MLKAVVRLKMLQGLLVRIQSKPVVLQWLKIAIAVRQPSASRKRLFAVLLLDLPIFSEHLWALLEHLVWHDLAAQVVEASEQIGRAHV